MKTTQKHTPGPWYAARSSGSQGLIISEANGANVAVSYDPHDAPLIAAAPDLLAALSQLLDSPDLNLDELHPETRLLMRDARDAIAKAEARP